jgi:hypothetical protein
MYLVCYESIDLSGQPLGAFNLVTNILQGAYFHCELVWVKDFKADSLFVSSRCDDGYPIIIKERTFNKYNKPVNVHWYKFTSLTVEQELEVRRTTQRLIDSKEYKMSMFKMVSAGVPTFLWRFREMVLGAYYSFNRLGEIEGITEYKGEHKNIFCSEFISIALNESKVWSSEIEQDGNIRDLVVRLLRLGRIEKIKGDSVHLLDHPTAFVLTEVDHRAAALPDLQVIKEKKIMRADDFT